MTDLKVRHPDFDLEGLTPQWAPNQEFAHLVNAFGIIPTAVEPFLIKVMRRAKADLDPVQDAELISDIDIFNKQEAQHYKVHEMFNQMVANNGYPELEVYDQRLKDDYAEMLRSRSMDWLLGYCAGFEALASTGAHYWVDDLYGDLLEGADSRVVNLWRWHLAEEYEHRTVVHRLFVRLCSGTPEEVFDKRVELFTFSVEHLAGHQMALRDYLLDIDRAQMNEADRAASLARQEAVDQAYAEANAGIAAVPTPSWDPETLPPPRNIEAVLSQYQ
jgi:uncharacterized protein